MSSNKRLPRKPQDCVRLLDINIQQTNELSQNEAIKDNAEVQKYYDLQIRAYKALRYYYLAKSQVAQKRWKEAVVLFDSAHKAVQTVNEGTFESETKELLQKVQDKSETELAIAKANLVLDQKPEENVIQFPQSQKTYKSKKPLVERLDEFREEPQLLSKNPNLVTLPPAMEPVPAKPLFFDLALNFVEFPDLSEKLDDGKPKQKQGAGISGFVKGLWGWGK